MLGIKDIALGITTLASYATGAVAGAVVFDKSEALLGNDTKGLIARGILAGVTGFTVEHYASEALAKDVEELWTTPSEVKNKIEELKEAKEKKSAEKAEQMNS